MENDDTNADSPPGAEGTPIGVDGSHDALFDDPLDDPLFTAVNPVFENKELLIPTKLPGSNRIVGRDEYIEEVATHINPIMMGDPPNNIIIYGKTGTGKSLVTRHVMGRAREAASARGIDVGSVYVDCSQVKTQTSVVRRIAQTLEPNVGLPKSGISTDQYYDALWRVLEEKCDALIVILDEIDKMRDDHDDDILMQLSRANEAGKLSTCDIGVIAISNRLSYRDNLNERVKSSFGHDEFVFDPYDATQLRDIMNHRRDAFKDGVLGNATIPRVAALAAQEHGDARKAIDILRSAGEIAHREGRRNDADLEDPSEWVVSDDHVDKAKKKAEESRFKESIRGSPIQEKAMLYAIAHLKISDYRNEHGVRYTHIYERYCEICDIIGLSTRTMDHLRNLLKQADLGDILELESTSNGRAKGVALFVYLTIDPKTVIDAVRESESTFRGILSSEEMSTEQSEYQSELTDSEHTS